VRYRGVPLLLVVSTVILAGCGWFRDEERPEQPVGSHLTREEVTVDGDVREFEVLTPADAGGEGDRSAVIVLHGGAGSIEGTVEQTGFDDVADGEGFLAVYPQGTESRLGDVAGYTWNAGGCCGSAERDEVDDVAFLVAVIDDLVADHDVDPERVYVTGISNGGMMAYRLACEAAEKVSAIAPVAATLMIDDCSPSEPVSVLHIHGLADENVPFEGGRNEKGLQRQYRPPVRDGLAVFVEADDCAGQPEESAEGEVATQTWSGCADGSRVELVTIESGGHSWPGGERLARFLDAPSSELDATAAIWDFFSSLDGTPPG